MTPYGILIIPYGYDICASNVKKNFPKNSLFLEYIPHRMWDVIKIKIKNFNYFVTILKYN